MSLKQNSLVLYKSYPARVVSVGEKIEIELDGGEVKRVRPKDIALLHEGPLAGLTELTPRTADPTEAWELLGSETMALPELSELIFGDDSPSAAWATWLIVSDGLYFGGTPEKITARPRAEMEAEKATRESKAAEKKAWDDFLLRVKSGKLLPGDEKQLSEVELLADGRGAGSRLLRELGSLPTPENAHALLLRLGHWNEFRNPHPVRHEVPLKVPEGEIPPLPDETRVDLTHLAAYAIDDEGSHDPDDAVSIDGDRLWVHVADVSALVSPDSPLDLGARGLTSSIYLPEIMVPMLPPEITTRLGLGLNETSPALSFGIRLGPEGEILDTEIVRSKVRVTRVTYPQVDERLNEEPFKQMWEIAQRYSARRERGTYAKIELPEVKLRLEGDKVTIRPLPALRSRMLVTEAMLMAGEAAARFAIRENLPFPFATQPSPDGVERPAEDLASMFAYRKKIKRSEIKCSPEPHFGLGLDAYARATSPLRRYLDLVAHQQLRAHLDGKTPLTSSEILTRVGAADAVSATIRKAERASNQHWTLVYLKQNPNWRGPGIVVDMQGPRATVILLDLGLEAKVNLRSDVELNSQYNFGVGHVDLPNLSIHLQVREA